MHKEITLSSDGEPLRVRALGLFELDGVGPDIPGPYRYQVLTYTGRIYELEYEIPDEPPAKPDVPEEEIEPRSPEWQQLKEWEVYQAAQAHEADRVRAVEQWLENCAAYILENCLEPADRARLVEPEDYRAVYAAVTVPRLKLDDIAAALRQTFRAEFAGQQVLDALWQLERGEAKLDPVAKWEAQLLNALRLVTPEEEARYAELPIVARARKVAAFKLDDWLGALEMERARKEMNRG